MHCRLLELLGLDAQSYIQFTRLLRWLYTAVVVFVAVPLACACYYINTKTAFGSPTVEVPGVDNSTAMNLDRRGGAEANSTSLLDNMQIFTAASITGSGLYVNISFEIIVTGLVWLFGELLSPALSFP